jgi:hypothetical protein
VPREEVHRGHQQASKETMVKKLKEIESGHLVLARGPSMPHAMAVLASSPKPNLHRGSLRDKSGTFDQAAHKECMKIYACKHSNKEKQKIFF